MSKLVGRYVHFSLVCRESIRLTITTNPSGRDWGCHEHLRTQDATYVANPSERIGGCNGMSFGTCSFCTCFHWGMLCLLSHCDFNINHVYIIGMVSQTRIRQVAFIDQRRGKPSCYMTFYFSAHWQRLVILQQLYGGGPLAKDAGDHLTSQGVQIVNLYGLTETGALTSVLPGTIDILLDIIKGAFEIG